MVPRALRRLVLALALIASARVFAAPLFETTVVFPITPNNRPNYRIPAIIRAPNGDLMVMSRNESSTDCPNNLRHLTAISRDGGERWSPVRRAEELTTPRCHGSIE